MSLRSLLLAQRRRGREVGFSFFFVVVVVSFHFARFVPRRVPPPHFLSRSPICKFETVQKINKTPVYIIARRAERRERGGKIGFFFPSRSRLSRLGVKPSSSALACFSPFRLSPDPAPSVQVPKLGVPRGLGLLLGPQLPQRVSPRRGLSLAAGRRKPHRPLGQAGPEGGPGPGAVVDVSVHVKLLQLVSRGVAKPQRVKVLDAGLWRRRRWRLREGGLRRRGLSEFLGRRRRSRGRRSAIATHLRSLVFCFASSVLRRGSWGRLSLRLARSAG